MSRYFPHAVYAEDQPLARTILWTHVLTRGVTTGSVIGLAIFSAREAARRFSSSSSSPSKSAPSKTVPSPPSSPSSSSPPPPKFDARRSPRLRASLLRTAGTSTAVTLGLVAVATAARMYGREDIEWRDRSWRLMANEGQLETDDWTYAGLAAGIGAQAALLAGGSRAGASASASAAAAAGWRGVLGAGGLGSLAGTLGYLGWRYGLHGGEFPGGS